MSAFTSESLLEMHGISKSFGATHALRKVSLQAKAGKALALIGENGAGKSTLMKVLSGAHQPDAGSMVLAGKPFRPQRPVDARRAGVAMIYQELNLAPDLTVEENIMLGIENRSAGFVRRSLHQSRVRDALSILGHSDLPFDRRVGTLSIGTQQIVEIARGLVSNARVMIFDEPTSSLSRQDVQRLFATLARLKEQGIAVIYISHFLEEVRQVAEDYVVLRDGQTAGAGTLTSQSDEQLVALMIGRSVENLFPRVPHTIGLPVLKVDQLCGEFMPRSVSFQLHEGEILGVFGLIGAGRTETLRCLLGLDTNASGRVEVFDRQPKAWPSRRLAAGLGLVSEDRKREGLAQQLSIEDNLTLSHLSPYSKLGLLKLGSRKQAVKQWMQALAVKAQGPEQPIGQLSGGNQQKVAIARVLHQQARILLLDEPTRGIDVGTKAEIYRLMGQLASQGKSIIFVSSYLPELMSVCDRLAVMSRGRLRDIRPVEEWTENEVLSAAIATESEPEPSERSVP